MEQKILRAMLRLAGKIALIVAVIFVLQELDAAAFEQVAKTETVLGNNYLSTTEFLGYNALKFLGY